MRTDGKGKSSTHVIHDRIEREYTIEDLEEWTEYSVQVVAFNTIGAGPWSPIVVARTRESGKGRSEVRPETAKRIVLFNLSYSS